MAGTFTRQGSSTVCLGMGGNGVGEPSAQPTGTEVCHKGAGQAGIGTLGIPSRTRYGERQSVPNWARWGLPGPGPPSSHRWQVAGRLGFPSWHGSGIGSIWESPRGENNHQLAAGTACRWGCRHHACHAQAAVKAKTPSVCPWGLKGRK